jgi:hypothetical protein
MAFTVCAVALYLFAGASGLKTSEQMQTLLLRLAMLVAVAVCGHMYWYLERTRLAAGLYRQQLAPAPGE